jgi:hypothetical protein
VIEFADAGTNADVRGAWRPDFSGESVAATTREGHHCRRLRRERRARNGQFLRERTGDRCT